jgi:hypothetical protein
VRKSNLKSAMLPSTFGLFTPYKKPHQHFWPFSFHDFILTGE